MSEDRLKIRDACKQRHSLSGVDAQALEGALQQVEAELERSKTEIKELEKRINDWRGTTSSETDRGMEWKDRAEKAEAEVKRVKAILAYQGIPF